MFFQDLFVYPLIEATATNVAKVIIDIMTKHLYLPTILITDKGSAFTSTIIAEKTQILGITLKWATTKHPQTIHKLERTQASLKTNLKTASGEYRRKWHKYPPLAVLIYNTTCHFSIGCESSKVFHGRNPFNVLDHQLGNNPNKNFLPTTEFAEEAQQRTQILIDHTKTNILQSYLKYNDCHDRKAKAAALKQKDYCLVLQPKADNQASKISFREYRWIGPFVIQKVLSNDKYIVRRLNTNKTQILHRFRIKTFLPNAPLEDKYYSQKLQPDTEIVIPQDDLYTISWEVDFKYDLFEPRKEDWTDVTTRRPTNDENGSVDNYVIENARGSCNERRNENDVTNDLQDEENVSNRGADITVPEKSKNEFQMRIWALEEGNTTFDLTLPPILLKNTRFSQNTKLPVPSFILLYVLKGHAFFWDYSDLSFFVKLNM